MEMKIPSGAGTTHLQFGEEGESTKDSYLGARMHSEGKDLSTAMTAVVAEKSFRSDASKENYQEADGARRTPPLWE